MGTFSLWHWLVLLVFVLLGYLLYLVTYKWCRSTPPANKSSEGPAGVAGWLLVLVVGLLFLGPLVGLVRVASDIALSEELYPSVKGLDAWENYKLATWIGFAFFVSTNIYAGYGLAKGRDPSVVSRVKVVMWIVIPAISLFMNVVLSYFFFDTAAVDAQYIAGLIGYFLITLFWTLYLVKSKRVRNTYFPEPLSAPSRQSVVGQGQEPYLNSLSQSSQSHLCENTRGQVTPEVSTFKQSDEVAQLPISSTDTELDESCGRLSDHLEEEAYDEVSKEISSGAVRNGLWTKLWAENEGNEVAVKAKYLKARVAEILNKHRLEEQNRSIVSKRLKEKVTNKR